MNMNDLIKMIITLNNSNVCMLYLETGKTILFNRSFSIENQSNWMRRGLIEIKF